jgi:hypothetical protein
LEKRAEQVCLEAMGMEGETGGRGRGRNDPNAHMNKGKKKKSSSK